MLAKKQQQQQRKNYLHAFVMLAKQSGWKVDRIKIEKCNGPTSAP